MNAARGEFVYLSRQGRRPQINCVSLNLGVLEIINVLSLFFAKVKVLISGENINSAATINGLGAPELLPPCLLLKRLWSVP
jgi:hypothetical protein